MSKISKTLGSSFSKLPPMVQWGIVIVVGIILFIVLRKLVKKIIPTKTQKESKEVIESYESEKQSWQQKGEVASYTDSQYKAFADKLYKAMDGFGTNEPAIYDVFEQLKNNIDHNNLVIAFGVRGEGWISDGHTLAEYITDDLGQEEIKRINQILADRGIVHRY